MEIKRNGGEMHGSYFMKLAVEVAEEKLESYLLANEGPLWGEENEAEAEALRENLRRAYEAAGTPEDDRIVL